MQIKENCSILSLFSLKGRILEKKGTSFIFFLTFAYAIVLNTKLRTISLNEQEELFI